MRHVAIKAVPSLHHEHSSYKWWVLTNIMISTFMVVLDSTIINTALPKVMASFGISVDTAQWFLTSYMLAFAILLPTSGWLADKFGYKKTYAAGLALFTLFSFGCGISWNSNSLILMRVGQGIGGGLLQPLGMAIIMREFSPKERGLAMGFWAISSAASVSLGPILGGYLADNFNWHLIFNINVPVGIVCIFATWIIQREYKTQQSYAFDFVGFFSLSIFLSFLLIALSSGNAQWNSGGWTSDFMILCYTLSIMSFILFMFTELTIKHPIVNLQLLTKYNFGLTNLVMFIFGIGMFGSVFLTPLYLQNVLGYTALQSGMVLLPVGILQALCGPIAGVISDKVNPKIPIILGVSLFTISFFLNSRLSILSEHAQIMMPLYLRGIAMGILFSPLSAIAMTDITKAQMAQASGLTNVIRQVGGSFGVAILETLLSQRVVFHTQTSGALLDRTAPQFAQCLRMLQMHAVHNAGSTMSNAANQSSVLLLSNFSKQMFVMGINDDYLFACICMAVCILPILILKTKKQGTPQKW